MMRKLANTQQSTLFLFYSPQIGLKPDDGSFQQRIPGWFRDLPWLVSILTYPESLLSSIAVLIFQMFK